MAETVQLYYSGNVPLQVDGFPKDCDRSREGSIHLFPRSGVEMTTGELAWIRANVPAIAERLDSRPIPPTPPAIPDAVLVPEMPVRRVERMRGVRRAEDQPEERPDSDG